jgi:hypothetical protein
MATPLSVLMVEDWNSDAELIARLFKKTNDAILKQGIDQEGIIL